MNPPPNSWLEKLTSFLTPTSRITKQVWKANWIQLEKRRFRQVGRWFFAATAVGYLLHLFLIDIPLDKQPFSLWASYRIGLAAYSLLGIALTFNDKFCRSSYYKVPVLIAGALFGLLQARTMIWHPTTPYFYAFLIPCLTTVILRMNLLHSFSYLSGIHLVQLPTFFAAGMETHLIVSALTMSLGAAVVFRSNMISDVNAFLSEQLKGEIQEKLNEALNITKLKEKALEKSNNQLVRKNLVFQTLLESGTNLPHFQELRALLEYALGQFEELFQDCGVMMVLSDQGTKKFGEAVFTKIDEDLHQLIASNYKNLMEDEFLQSLKADIFSSERSTNYPTESLISLPMISSADKVVGTALFIGVEMEAEAIETISLFLALVTSCGENLALTKRLEHLAHVDNLTSTYNRNFFEREIKRQIRTNNEYPDLHFSLLLIDVNGLKTVNDYYGHKEGDNLIIKVASLLKTTCRRTDVVCRLGGDEFVVICPETRSASKLLERIRQKESQMSLHFRTDSGDDVDLPVHVSVGIASTVDYSADGILRAADELMYRDKRDFYESKNLKQSS